MIRRSTAFILGMVGLLVGGCTARERVIVPQGYRGFVGIFYERGSVPLARESGTTTIEFPADGIVFTSSTLNTHWKILEFFERDGPRLIPLRSNLVGPIPTDIPPQERIFTGGMTITDGPGPPGVVYFVGDAADRAKLDWQSSTQWWKRVLQSRN